MRKLPPEELGNGLRFIAARWTVTSGSLLLGAKKSMATHPTARIVAIQ